MTFEWFSNISNNRVEHEFEIFEHVFKWIKDGSFFSEEKAKNRQSLLSRMTLFIYEENVFSSTMKKKYKTFFFSSYLCPSIHAFLNDAKKCQKPWFDMSTYLTIQFDNKHGIDYLSWDNYLM